MRRLHTDEDAISDHSSAEESMRSGSDQDTEAEAWGGIQATVAHTHKNLAEADPSGSHILKPPTREVLRKIKDTSELFRSTSFKSQVHAHPFCCTTARVTICLRSTLCSPTSAPNTTSHNHWMLSSCLFTSSLWSCLPPHLIIHFMHQEHSPNRGINVPYVHPLLTEETNWKVSFEKPSEIMLAGSWIMKTTIKAKDCSSFTANLAIEMPLVSMSELVHRIQIEADSQRADNPAAQRAGAKDRSQY